jgi:hypothetical protein
MAMTMPGEVQHPASREAAALPYRNNYNPSPADNPLGPAGSFMCLNPGETKEARFVFAAARDEYVIEITRTRFYGNFEHPPDTLRCIVPRIWPRRFRFATSTDTARATSTSHRPEVRARIELLIQGTLDRAAA